MDGVHDMGGMHGFGRVPYEKDEPAFHHEWERRVFGLFWAATLPEGATLDMARHFIEQIPPAVYLRSRYFERWLYALTTAMVASELVTLDEVTQGRAAAGSIRREDATRPEQVDPYLSVLGSPLLVSSFVRDAATAPRFQVGSRVRTANPHPAGHTRLPRYARAKVGEVRIHHGAHVLPDTNAHGEGECPTHLYTVAFTSQELWGPEGTPNDTISLDIWECHLEAV